MISDLLPIVIFYKSDFTLAFNLGFTAVARKISEQNHVSTFNKYLFDLIDSHSYELLDKLYVYYSLLKIDKDVLIHVLQTRNYDGLEYISTLIPLKKLIHMEEFRKLITTHATIKIFRRFPKFSTWTKFGKNPEQIKFLPNDHRFPDNETMFGFINPDQLHVNKIADQLRVSRNRQYANSILKTGDLQFISLAADEITFDNPFNEIPLREEVIEFLIKKGYRFPPNFLHRVIKEGTSLLMFFILDNYCDFLNKYDYTAIDELFARKDFDTIKYLLDLGFKCKMDVLHRMTIPKIPLPLYH